MNVALIIPCLNEAAEIGRLVASAKRFVSHILVIDDGSMDGTGELAAAEGAVVIRHDAPKGKGTSIRRGVQWASAHGFEWVLLMDGDGQHDPEEIPLFLEAAMDRENPVELIVGNRMENPGSMPLQRRWVNRWMSRRISSWAGQRVPDTQCGYRLLKTDLWKRLRLSTTHYELDSEMMVEALRQKARIAWVPIRVIYGKEKSKIRPWQDTLRWFRWWRNQ